MRKDYSNIKTMKQLELQIRQLEIDAAKGESNIRKDINYAAYYYRPTRMINSIGVYIKHFVMNFFRSMVIILGLGVALNACSSGEDQTEFIYSIDQFADIEVLRYQIPDWDGLTLQQKEYVYHLSEAAKAGRDIIWVQNFKYNLPIRKVLESIIEKCSEFEYLRDYLEAN